jgi:Putative MetA-pathway of phenol degradation
MIEYAPQTIFVRRAVWRAHSALTLASIHLFLSLAVGLGDAGLLRGQDNYEIQVYGADTVAPRQTMMELHSNFTISGSKTVENGLFPTHHSFHETLEITHGITDWFELGYYNFTSARSGEGWDWVGTHLRPRVRVPEERHWPVGLSLSVEFGYQRRQFSPDTWTLEIRPILDKQIGKWYFSFNPSVDRSLAGENREKGFAFSPNFKVSYMLIPKASVGLEYYGSLGPISKFDPLSDQEQQVFPAVDLNLSPNWEVNFGLGVGMTRSTDHLIAKLILGYRFKKFPFSRH